MTNSQKKKSPAYERLSKKYPADQYGVWEVRGEDPNCDLGGHHHEPLLGYVQGLYGEVLDWAIEQSGFWQWGAGGSIRSTEVQVLSYQTEEEAIWARLKRNGPRRVS